MGASGFCRSDLPVAIIYAISMNVPAEQDAPPTMWVGGLCVTIMCHEGESGRVEDWKDGRWEGGKIGTAAKTSEPGFV